MQRKTEDPDVRDFATHLDLQAPLDPRDAFKGGRTNATRLHCQADPQADETIRYYDYTNLYLWVIPRSSTSLPVWVRRTTSV